MSAIENAYPLSELQKGMVFYTEKEDGLYHDVFIYSFSGEYDFNLIKKAFQILMDENPVLRTSFRIGDLSEPIQLVHKKAEVSITEFINFEDKLLENDINDYVSERRHLSFEWELPPLWQVGVFKNQNNDKFSICLDFHHSILDGWSVATLMQTFCEYYFKELNGEAHNILIEEDNNKGTYADFIKLERSASDDKIHQKFWENEVKKSNLVSPYGVTQSKNTNIKIYDKSRNLNSDDTVSLYQLSNRLKVPLKNICLSVHLKVLSMLSNEKKITTGIVANGRPEIGGESTLGLFLNTLPFTVKIPDSKNWSDFILSNFEKEKEILPYRRYPLSKMLSDNNKDAIFYTAFNYVDFHAYKSDTLNNRFFSLYDLKVTEKTNFSFSAQFVNNSLENKLGITITYNSEQFSNEQIDEALDLYLATFKIVLNYLDHPVSDNRLILLEDSKWYAELVGDRDDNDLVSILERFEYIVQNHGEKVAIKEESQSYTYSQLDKHSNFLAYLLQNKMLLNKQSKVGVYLDRSFELISSILAIWKLGAVYVPIDRKFPIKRIEHIINDSSIDCIIARDEKDIENLPSNTPVVSLDVLKEDEPAIERKITSKIVEQNDIAYIIYTSGTTGVPKGVCISHQGISNLIKNYDYFADDKVLMTFNIAFDGCLFDILISLSSGSCLCVPLTQSLLAENLKSNIEYYGISVLTTTPSILSSVKPQEFKTLRMVSVAGEKCPFNLAKNWSKFYEFRNLYGPSEGTISTSEFNFSSKIDIDEPFEIPIGKPINNIAITIVDNLLQPLPKNVIGEIAISGQNLALGYTSQKETDKKFKTFLTCSKQSREKRVYLSGDKGKITGANIVYFYGRVDSQIKINGIRIEVSEIKNILEKFPNVETAHIIKGEKGSREYISAYLVLENKQLDFEENLVDKLIDFLKQYLPLYMVPEEFYILEETPTNDNGKLSIHELDKNAIKLHKSNQKMTLPRNETEQYVFDTLCQLLGSSGMSIYSNIFEMGCNSLTVLELTKKINLKYSIQLSIQKIFENPTIEKIAIEILKQLIIERS